MKHEKGTCKKCKTEDVLIVNKTHKLCASCNKERLEGQKQPYNRIKPKNDTPQRKKCRIPQKSAKQVVGEEKYEAVKRQKHADMIAGGYYKCFFTNKYLNDERDNVTWHHVLGRKGELLYDYRNIFPALWEYHYDYHHKSIGYLMKQRWYKDFLNRLAQLNHKAYNKELGRQLKGGIIDAEMYREMYL